MSLADVEQAKRNAVMARARLDSHIAALQLRLRPANLAGEAWDGVKGKSADLADGAMEAVKKRPAAVSAALGALALFLAREPLKRAAVRLISGANPDEDGIEAGESELSEQRPKRARRVKKGVS
jgi:hypothetical protein